MLIYPLSANVPRVVYIEVLIIVFGIPEIIGNPKPAYTRIFEGPDY